MEDDKGYVRISKTGRNGYGVKTENITVSLPDKDVDYIVKWAKSHNVTVSRAVHDLIWAGHYAMKGEYRPYALAPEEKHE